MNHNEAEKFLRANVKDLPEPLKSAVEFTLATFYQSSKSELAKKFLAIVPYEVFMARNLRETNPELKAKIDAAYYTLMNDETVWLNLEDLPHEEWRDVIGYEGFYQVSNLGRVKSLKCNKPKILKAYFYRQDEYLAVELFIHSKQKPIKIHRLVAEAFLPNPDNKPQVNHIDGNKLNNRLTNFEWVTVGENVRHAYKLGLIKRKSGCEHHQAKLTEEQVRYIRKVCIPGDRKFGINALARKFVIGVQTMFRVYTRESYKDIT